MISTAFTNEARQCCRHLKLSRRGQLKRCHQDPLDEGLAEHMNQKREVNVSFSSIGLTARLFRPLLATKVKVHTAIGAL
nr:hypothetical protein Ade03nite_08970 [Actinoplanes derwentensis]